MMFVFVFRPCCNKCSTDYWKSIFTTQWQHSQKNNSTIAVN